MKKTKIAIPMILIIALMLAGCSFGAFTVVSGGKNTTITANNAEDGQTMDAPPIYVGKGKTVKVESSLDKGRLQIDFAEATVISYTDEPDEITVWGVTESVTVGAGDSTSLSLPQSDYVLQLKAIGTTNGKVSITIE
jgi:hypothetical protein